MSKYIDELSERMDLNNWPHQFTKKDKPVQIGEDPETHDPIMAAPMVCVHCGAEFVAGQTSRPPDPCPARNKKRDMKRILG
jgi:hypothetical protein